MRLAALHFDFAPGASRSSFAARLFVVALALLLAWQSIVLVLSFANRQREAAGLARFAVREMTVPRAPSAAKPDLAEVARMRSVRQIAQTLATPWSDLIASLEEAPQQSVALIAVEPSASKQSLRLTAEARDATAMLAYVAALQADPRLTAVMLVSHQVQSQAPGTPIRFKVQATWGAPS